MDELRDVGPGAVLVIDTDMVRKALSSFAPISGAGPSGLRPSHLQEALRHSSSDQTLRLVSEVIQLMLRGEIPEDIRPWMCGASLMAPRKPNGSCENHCVLWRYRHRCHCSLSYRRGPFESKSRKQLSLSSCGWVLIRSGQFKITL